MAIAHVATEYVFSDFLLKEQNQARYRSVRTELALDKMVTCVAVGLPLLLISLAFAQEVSVGTQISCFAPTNFSWRQAAYVDSFCWASVHTHTLPLWLHKFFPYILLLVAVLMYTPALFWRFSAAPLLLTDLGFIMEELDRCYNRAVTLAKRMATSGRLTPDSDPTEGCFNYPLVEKFLTTKRCSRTMLLYYLSCRGLTFVTLVCACIYLGYYLRLASVTDEFGCTLRVGLLTSDPSVPEKVQCKLIAVGVFSLLSLVNLIVFIALIPVVIYTSFRPFLCHRQAHFLETYQSLPTVLELLRKRGECSEEDFDAMGLLQTLCLVKMDAVDGNKPTEAAGKQDQLKSKAAESVNSPTAANNREAKNNSSRPDLTRENDCKTGTEMKELTPLLLQNSDATGSRM
ncbi:pannexin-1-like isoform X2 [Solea solea]|uniref:pannexin-1-like isoform X2 n=1 Tax=Solea solea TaxID=90069 RepID=UPI00272D3537|nr:pannexin-1-like isoform X2 [Solea solea]